MNDKRNLIAHCNTGGSDKVYMVCIRRDNQGNFIVLGKWGRRGKTLSSGIKLQTQSETAAVLQQKNIFANELKKGYVDIDSPNYSGPVSRQSDGVKNALEPEENFAITPCPTCGQDMTDTVNGVPSCRRCALERMKKNAPEIPVQTVEDTVYCVNNLGIEDRFDEGIEYVCEAHKDKLMVYVYDKMGRRDEYFKERFYYPSEMQRGKKGGPFWVPKEGETANIRILKSREPSLAQAWDTAIVQAWNEPEQTWNK